MDIKTNLLENYVDSVESKLKQNTLCFKIFIVFFVIMKLLFLFFLLFI